MTGTLSLKELGSLNSTLRKNSLRVSSMLKLNHLILSTEKYLVLTNDASSSDSRNTNFLRITLLSALAAVINIVILVIHSLVDGISKRKRST